MDGLGRTNHVLHLFQQFWSEYMKTSDAQRPGDSCSLLVCCYTYHCVRYLVYQVRENASTIFVVHPSFTSTQCAVVEACQPNMLVSQLHVRTYLA